MNNLNKRYIILFLGVFVLFIIFAVVLFFQQNQQQSPLRQSSQKNTVITVHGPAQHVASMPTPTLEPPSSSAEETTQLFYTYYFSSAQNPLANGAYKNNPYLSDDFKSVIGSLYNNGNAPVFCSQNKAENIIIGKEQTVYYNNGYLTQETISQAPPSSKDLYRVELIQVNGKWLIFDINCI